MIQDPQHSGSLYETIHDLVMAQLNSELSADDRARLEHLVLHDATARRLYAQHIFESVNLHWWSASQLARSGEAGASRPRILVSRDDLGEVPGDRAAELGDSALTFSFEADGLFDITLSQALEHLFRDAEAGRKLPRPTAMRDDVALGDAGRGRAMWWRGRSTGVRAMIALAAVIVVFAGLAAVLFLSTPPGIEAGDMRVARLTRSAGAQFGTAASAVDVGETIRTGRLQLTEGLVQITFDSGAHVVVEAPAVCEPASANKMILRSGRLSAFVPPRAAGFTIETPSAVIVDQGTRFGVVVDDNGQTQVHVFEGRVEVRWQPGTRAQPSSLLLTQGRALQMGPDGAAPVDLALAPHQFVQELTETAALRLHNTGRGLAAGQADPNWQLTVVGAHPGFSPPPVSVVPAHPSYLPPSSESQWVSYATDPPGAHEGGRYLFRTRFGLKGVELNSVRITGRFIADNIVTAIRINGQDAPVPPNGPEIFTRYTDFTIDRGFVEGENVLEFEVENVDNLNPLALRVEVEGAARRNLLLTEKSSAAPPMSK